MFCCFGRSNKETDCSDANLRRAPDEPGVVTAAWLTEQLTLCLPRGEVAAVEGVRIEQIGASGADGRKRTDGGGNSGSRIVRLRLEGVSPAARDLLQDDSLVLKWAEFKSVPTIAFPMRVAQTILFNIKPADLFRVEHYFFLNAAPEVIKAGVRVPRSYVSALTDGREPAACCRLLCDCRANLTHTLLMQDFAGYSAAQPFSAAPEERAASALRNVARFHRATWGRHRRWAPDLAAIVGGGGLSTAPIALFGLRGAGVSSKKPNFAASKAPANVQAAWGENNDPRGDPGLQIVRDAAADPGFLPAFRWLQGQWSTLSPTLGNVEPQCMVHGDFHHWNNLFGPGGDQDIALLDWQYFGAGRVAYELLYFFATSVDPGSGEVDRRLLEVYHEALTVDDPDLPALSYPLAELEMDCRRALVDAAVTLCLSYGGRTFGVKYTPSVYRRAVSDEKQRDYALGGMFIAGRMWARLINLHKRHPDSFSTERAPTAAQSEAAPLLS